MPYRRARPVAEALGEVRREAGQQFDPRVVEAALAIPEARWAALLGALAAARVNPSSGAFPREEPCRC